MRVDLESILPVVLPILVALLWYLRVRHRFSAGRLTAFAVIAVYVLLVSDYTIFPLEFNTKHVESGRTQATILSKVSLVPFRGWSWKYLTSVQVWGNFVLGMPWGFVYPFVVPVPGWRSAARAGALFALAIESLQLLISLLYGFAYRVVDVNDLLLNFSGGLVGYAILRVLALAYQAISGRDWQRAGFPDKGLWRHVEAVLLAHGRHDGLEARKGCSSHRY